MQLRTIDMKVWDLERGQLFRLLSDPENVLTYQGCIGDAGLYVASDTDGGLKALAFFADVELMREDYVQ